MSKEMRPNALIKNSVLAEGLAHVDLPYQETALVARKFDLALISKDILERGVKDASWPVDMVSNSPLELHDVNKAEFTAAARRVGIGKQATSLTWSAVTSSTSRRIDSTNAQQGIISGSRDENGAFHPGMPSYDEFVIDMRTIGRARDGQFSKHVAPEVIRTLLDVYVRPFKEQ